MAEEVKFVNDLFFALPTFPVPFTFVSSSLSEGQERARLRSRRGKRLIPILRTAWQLLWQNFARANDHAGFDIISITENQDRHFAYMDLKCRKGILLKTGVNEGGFWEPPNLPDRPLLYRLLTFSVKRSVACVAREIQSAALEIWRSHAIFQAPLPLEHWLMHRRNVCKFYILKVRFPFAFCLFGCCYCCFCFLLFSVKR